MARSIRRRISARINLRRLAGKHPRCTVAAPLDRGPLILAARARLFEASLMVVRDDRVPMFSGADPGPAGFDRPE
jgi:hypothetical protein